MRSHTTIRRLGARLAPAFLTSLALACSSAKDEGRPTPGEQVPDTSEGTGGHEEVEPGLDVLRYDLRGEFDWSQNKLVATVSVTALPGTRDPSTIRLDGVALDVKTVHLAGGGDLPFGVVDGGLEIDLSSLSDVAPDKEITLEIGYETGSNAHLRSFVASKGDPAGGRAVYTHSEPEGARWWMPCHDTPSDRAIFSIDMRVSDGEMMIANGTLISDASDGAAGHRVKYETTYTLPTYLMAFAIGDFEIERRDTGPFPTSVWHRRGLPGDYGALLDELARGIDLFQGLLGPYPFDQYTVVLLPSFPVEGTEHASISFQSEHNSTAATMIDDLTLTLHELAHQWVGDLVTIKGWDDLWIKEGMATLLAYEGMRPYLDASGAMTLNGDFFNAWDGDAVIDPGLAPSEKYTSGPYGRAAWLLTQIRSVIGEAPFWAALRGLLVDHRYGAVDTDEFVDAFAPALRPEATAQVKRALLAKELPSLTVEPAAGGGAFVTLQDPGGALVAPVDVSWISDDGARRAQTLEVGQRVEVAPSPRGELLILDPLDRHPNLRTLVRPEEDLSNYIDSVAPLQRPTTTRQIELLLATSGAHQRAAMQAGLPPMQPPDFPAFLEGLDALSAQASAIAASCVLVKVGGLGDSVRSAWIRELAVAASGSSPARWTDFWPYFPECAGVLFAAPPAVDASDARVRFLANTAFLGAKSLEAWGQIATRSSSLRSRIVAAEKLRQEASSAQPDDLPAWRALFADILSSTEVREVAVPIAASLLQVQGDSAADNAAVLQALSALLRSPGNPLIPEDLVCTAHALTREDPVAWSEFVEGIGDIAFPPRVTALVRDPSMCPG